MLRSDQYNIYYTAGRLSMCVASRMQVSLRIHGIFCKVETPGTTMKIGENPLRQVIFASSWLPPVIRAEKKKHDFVRYVSVLNVKMGAETIDSRGNKLGMPRVLFCNIPYRILTSYLLTLHSYRKQKEDFNFSRPGPELTI